MQTIQTIQDELRPAQREVHRTAHNQDLTEIPKRAKLDRELEGNTFNPPAPPEKTEALV